MGNKFSVFKHFQLILSNFITILIMPKASTSGEGRRMTRNMGESFQDYSWIQDLEADFP